LIFSISAFLKGNRVGNVYPKDVLNEFKNIQKASCFVIMPFAPAFDRIWESIREALRSKELNLIARRADDIVAPNILATILKGIAQAEFILADLTGANPNVFYELGIAHCYKKSEKVILLTQDMSFVPFDLRQLRCITYVDTPDGHDRLRQELVHTFAAYSKDTFRFRLHQGKKFRFDKRLVGKGNNFYSLSFECLYVGRGAVKLKVHFEKFSMDDLSPTDSQFLFLSIDQHSGRLENLPWRLYLIESNEVDALVQLEKD
jgi:hypothetical protein